MSASKSKSGAKGTPTPHDLVFKQFLTHTNTARDFMQLHLPAELQSICDFNTLKLESGNFVEEDLRPYFSDVLYSLQTVSKRTARTVLTGMCYSVGSVMRQGSSSLTRLTGQSAMTSRTWRR